MAKMVMMVMAHLTTAMEQADVTVPHSSVLCCLTSGRRTTQLTEISCRKQYVCLDSKLRLVDLVHRIDTVTTDYMSSKGNIQRHSRYRPVFGKAVLSHLSYFCGRGNVWSSISPGSTSDGVVRARAARNVSPLFDICG